MHLSTVVEATFRPHVDVDWRIREGRIVGLFARVLVHITL